MKILQNSHKPVQRRSNPDSYSKPNGTRVHDEDEGGYDKYQECSLFLVTGAAVTPE